MINNELLGHLSDIFNYSDEELRELFSLGQCQISESQLTAIFSASDDTQYRLLTDLELAGFLNGFIIAKRGAKEGVHYQPESKLNNNIIFNKIKIALALKADDVLAILQLAELNLGKYELSAFFRNVNHKHYRECSDEVLSRFIKGLTAKLSA